MRKLFMVCCLLGIAMVSFAEDVTFTVPEMDLKLTVPTLEPKLTCGETMTYRPELSLNVSKIDAAATSNGWKPDFDFFKSKTNPGVKPYKFMDDMTFVGVPLFVAGIAIKGDKAMFRQNTEGVKKNTQLLTDFKTGIDDYSQYFGPAMTIGLKLGGYEGRSDWPRLLASAGMSYGIMAALVNGIKYTAKEMRPDGSQANSWPSGHTATAFVGASLLHKEYGLTRSPWFSVAGYGVAAATGVMRVLNNRHWVSDVMSGAGIGIMSTELGYALCDVLFKGKGLLRNDLDFNSENPSFFSISMGVGLGTKNIDFGLDDLVGIERFDPQDVAEARAAEDESGRENVEFRHSTVVDGEGAYFFNKYIGIGGRFRVRAMSAKSFDRFVDVESMEGQAIDAWSEFFEASGKPQTIESYDAWNNAMWGADGENGPVRELNAIVQSDHLTEFSASLGLYFNIPLSKHFSLGSKILVGRSFMQEMDIDGFASGKVKDMGFTMTATNKTADGNLKINTAIDYPTTVGEYNDYSWDYMTLSGNSSTTWGTGLSLTYRYKSNFSWKVFCDYDYTKKNFTLKYDSFNYMRQALTNNSYILAQNIEALYPYMDAQEYKKTKKMNFFTLGLSFLVNL